MMCCVKQLRSAHKQAMLFGLRSCAGDAGPVSPTANALAPARSIQVPIVLLV